MVHFSHSFQSKVWMQNLLVALAYLLFAKIGLFFALRDPTITIFWPAGGFALALLLISGSKYLPGILLGAIIAGVVAADKPWSGVILGVADTIESYSAYWLLTHKLSFNSSLESRRDFFNLTLIAAGLASAVSAIIAASSLLAWHEIGSDLYWQIGLRWWMGDMLGIAIITPLMLVWRHPPEKLCGRLEILECLFLFSATFLSGQIIFYDWFHGYHYAPRGISWLILLMVWAALRFGRHHTIALQLIVFFQALWSVSRDMEHFTREIVQSTIVSFWMFGMAIAIGGVALAILALENKKIQISLREGEERLRLALAAGSQGWFDVNIRTGEVSVSADYIKMIGFDPSTFHSSLDEWKSSLHPNDRESVSQTFAECLSTGGPTTMEYRRQSGDGSWIWISSVGKVVEWDVQGNPIRMIGTHANVTERKRIEDELREQKEFFRIITDNSEDFIAVLDLQGRRIYNNQAYGRLFGNIGALEGTDSFAEIHPDDRERVKQIFRETVESGQGQRADFRFLLPSGEVRYIESTGGLIKDSKGKALFVVVVSHDITERKRVEREIQNLAFYDQLTELPNRRLLNDRLSQSMASSKRSGSYCALIFLDLDNFKPLNDAHGHPMGDLLLIEVAERLRRCVRKVDTVARFGGDEFVVVLNQLDVGMAESKKQAEIVAQKISTTLAEPYLLKVKQHGADATIKHHCTASIGVTMFLNHESNMDDLLKWADLAMYKAKESGRNRIEFYDATKA